MNDQPASCEKLYMGDNHPDVLAKMKEIREMLKEDSDLCEFIYDRRAFFEKHFSERDEATQLAINRFCYSPYSANFEVILEGSVTVENGTVALECKEIEAYKANGDPFANKLKGGLTIHPAEDRSQKARLAVDLKNEPKEGFLTVIIYSLELDLDNQSENGIALPTSPIVIEPAEDVTLESSQPNIPSKNVIVKGFLTHGLPSDPTVKLYLKFRDDKKMPEESE